MGQGKILSSLRILRDHRSSQDKQILRQLLICSVGSIASIQVISRGDNTAINRDEMLLPDLDKNPIALIESVFARLESHQNT